MGIRQTACAASGSTAGQQRRRQPSSAVCRLICICMDDMDHWGCACDVITHARTHACASAGRQAARWSLQGGCRCHAFGSPLHIYEYHTGVGLTAACPAQPGSTGSTVGSCMAARWLVDQWVHGAIRPCGSIPAASLVRLLALRAPVVACGSGLTPKPPRMRVIPNTTAARLHSPNATWTWLRCMHGKADKATPGQGGTHTRQHAPGPANHGTGPLDLSAE